MKRFFALLPLIFLCGCWDYSEASMQEYVLGVGIDRAESGYLVTVETADLSGSPESPGTAKCITCEGKSLFDAIRNAIPHAGKKLYWGHCSLAVIDDDIKDEQLHEVLDVFLRAQDVYQSISVLIARDVSAAEIFAADHNGSDSVSAHCLHVFQNQASSRRFRKCELWEYVRDNGLAVLPTVSLANGMPQVSGGAVYRNEALLGMLSGDEILMLSLLTEDSLGGWLPNIRVSPDIAVSTEILAGNVSAKDDRLFLTLTLAVSSSDTEFDLSDETERASAESVIARFWEDRANALIVRSRRDGFSELIHPEVRHAEVTVRLQNAGMRVSEGGI